MSNKIAVLAASVPLMLSVAGTFGSEPQFQTPTTDRAQQMRPLLSRAAHAVHDQISGRTGNRISDVWIFPTVDEHTVFVQYTVTSQGELEQSQVHLELLKMQGDQVVQARDLTRITDDSTLRAQQGNGRRDWSASIGTGHAMSTETSALSSGSPASAHWSALVGSGHATNESTQRRQVAGNVTGSQVAQAHWTSKIGTARAVESNTNTHSGKSAS